MGSQTGNANVVHRDSGTDLVVAQNVGDIGGQLGNVRVVAIVEQYIFWGRWQTLGTMWSDPIAQKVPPTTNKRQNLNRVTFISTGKKLVVQTKKKSNLDVSHERNQFVH